jgi:hypothetical protein
MCHRHNQHAHFINGKRVVVAVIGGKLPAAGLRKSAKPRKIRGCVNLRQPQPDSLTGEISVDTPKQLHITVGLCLILAAEP